MFNSGNNLTYSLTHLLTHSLTHSLTYLLTYLLTTYFVHTLVNNIKPMIFHSIFHVDHVNVITFSFCKTYNITIIDETNKICREKQRDNI